MAFQAQFRHDGNRIDFTPAGALAAGDVVVIADASDATDAIIGVVANDLAANEAGVLLIKGVFAFAKAAGVIALGDTIFWDNTANVATLTATSNIRIGHVVKAALTGDTVVYALLTPH